MSSTVLEQYAQLRRQDGVLITRGQFLERAHILTELAKLPPRVTGTLEYEVDAQGCFKVVEHMQRQGVVAGATGTRAFYASLLSLYNDVPVFMHRTAAGAGPHIIVYNPMANWEVLRDVATQLSTVMAVAGYRLKVLACGRDCTKAVLTGSTVDFGRTLYGPRLMVTDTDGTTVRMRREPRDQLVTAAKAIVSHRLPYTGLKPVRAVKILL